MPIAEIIEISCKSLESFEEAIQDGISRVSKTIHNIKSAWVKEQHVVIESNKVSLYLGELTLTFVLE